VRDLYWQPFSIEQCQTYADLIEATFDTYRWELYRSLPLELPKNEAEESAFGKKKYLSMAESNKRRLAVQTSGRKDNLTKELQYESNHPRHR
jgi:hypothetical protein